MNARSDRIEVRGIRAFGRHGITPSERENEQPLDIDVVLELDVATARRSDRLTDTLDYAAIHARVVALVGERSYALLERLGDEIVEALLADQRIVAVAVTLAKPGILDGATPRVIIHGARQSRG